jgi:IS605 OrfB family transposase
MSQRLDIVAELEQFLPVAKRVKPKVKKETGESTRTFQLRLKGEYPALDDMARRYGTAKRTVYGRASLERRSFDSYKEEMCARFGLPARVFNALNKDLSGLVSSAQEKAKFDIGQVEDTLEKLAKDIARFKLKLDLVGDKKRSSKDRKACQSALIHKKRSLQRQKARLAKLQARSVDPYPSLCFGSRRRFNAQHHLQANGYQNHTVWLSDWRAARSDQFLVVGSNDEPDGNTTCRASLSDDGRVNMKLFLGDADYLELPNLKLAYGQPEWVEALLAAQAEFRISQAWQKETARLKADVPDEADAQAAFRKERLRARKAQPKLGHGIAYRFQRDAIGWRIFITVTKTVPLLSPDYVRGAIGVDLNDGFVSVSRLSAGGSLLYNQDLPLVLNGLTTGQRRAAIHDLAHQLVQEAIKHGVPLVIEKLDFSGKKLRLKEVGCAAAARRLGSFAYSQFSAVLKAHARLHGVCLVEVNPAFTSVIGAALHAVPNGLTVHGSAAMSIARRAMSVEETLPERLRVWMSGRRPLAMERPQSLRRKAAVEPLWQGWMELSKAVRAARALALQERRKGHVRRHEVRQQAALEAACEIPF